MLRPSRRIGLAVAVVLAIAAGCGAPERPNVVLISIDTLRADAVGAYGGPVPTPTLDALAAAGVRLEWAFAPTPTTAPSHVTLLSGRHVQNHGTLGNGPITLPALPLEAAFREAGYTTAAFVSSYVLSHKLGWQTGFTEFDDTFPDAGPGGLREMVADEELVQQFAGEPLDREGLETTHAARAWLASAEPPFFLFVHYMDPHTPYHARRVYLRRLKGFHPDLVGRSAKGYSDATIRKAIVGYQAEVLYVDAALAGLLAALDERGLARDTLVVVTADHGEGLGQHGWMGHTVSLYDEQIRVPWLLRWPRVLPAGAQLATPVGLVDVAPTIAALAGVTLPAPVDGRSLANALRRGAEPAAEPVFGIRPRFTKPYREHFGEKRYVRTARWKLIRGEDTPPELYDLTADPTETHNVIEREPAVAQALGAALDTHAAAASPAGAQPALSEDQRRALEALGYVE